MSDAALTGYDNVDASPAAKGARDEEVYLYDAPPSCSYAPRATRAERSRMACSTPKRPAKASACSSTGAQTGPTTAKRRRRPLTGWRGASPAGRRSGSDSAAQALRQPRYLSDSGRLFFDSADPLVPSNTPHATRDDRRRSRQVGVESVYEYEPVG